MKGNQACANAESTAHCELSPVYSKNKRWQQFLPFFSIRAILSFVNGEKQIPAVDPLEPGTLSSLFADLAAALGWVGAQALLFLQPLLTGWVDASAIEQAVRWLESPLQHTDGRDL